jgi:hypothetical protein
MEHCDVLERLAIMGGLLREFYIVGKITSENKQKNKT